MAPAPSETSATPSRTKPARFVGLLKAHLLLWCVPLAVFTLAAIGFAVWHTPMWRASQALLVRDETGGQARRQGRFEDVESMKNAMETIMEIARNRSVVTAALRQLGPRSDQNIDQNAAQKRDPWPRPQDVEQLRRSIAVTAPRGAEFGKTEVIYLSVTATDPQRALRLAAAVCDELEARLRDVRDAKARSIIQELQRTVALADEELATATTNLQALEAKVGSDLGELRSLDNSQAGDSNLARTQSKIESELLRVRTDHEVNVQLRDLLQAAHQDPDQLVATPNRLLQSQVALGRLKKGLIDAQLHKAELLGHMSPAHPKVQAAILAEREIHRHLRDELTLALKGTEDELSLSGALVASLGRQLAEVTTRLDRLAALRAHYHNLVADVRHRGTIVERARQDLASGKASREAAVTSSVLTRVDRPDLGDGPLGPTRATIVLAGLVGGLTSGWGLVLLVVPTGHRRWSDRLGLRRRTDATTSQRRTEDPTRGRRVTDPQVPLQPEPRRPEKFTEPVATAGDDRRGGQDRRDSDRRGG